MASQASIIRKTVGGAAWTVFTSVGSRIIGALGAIVVTYFISPEIAGEVKVAYVLVTSANVFSTLGIGQYVASKPKESSAVVWHATVLHLGIGVPAILPSILSTFTILFANAMGAYATAYQLVSSSYNLVPLRISALITGDIRTKPELGSALAVLLALTLILIMLLNDWASRLASRKGLKS